MHGDCFVVINNQGKCWDGTTWVNLWSQALQFRRPDPAYEMCEQEAGKARSQTGIKGVVAYITADASEEALDPFEDLSDVDLRAFSAPVLAA